MTTPCLLANATQQASPLQQLDPPQRAAVLMTLLALILTALGLILLTMIGARWVRRVIRDRRPPRRWPRHGPTARTGGPPSGPPLESPSTTETISERSTSDKTRG